jgi:hypothetical protein
MFVRGDIVCITGIHDSGKTTFAKYLAGTLDKNYIHIDFIHTPYEKLDEIYETYKDIQKVIIFDNYVELRNNVRRMQLFIDNNKLTLIFVLNYISKIMISKADILFFAKNNDTYILDSYYKHINKYFKNNKKKLYSHMKKLENFGFLCIDKDNKYKNNKEEEIIKIE